MAKKNNIQFYQKPKVKRKGIHSKNKSRTKGANNIKNHIMAKDDRKGFEIIGWQYNMDHRYYIHNGHCIFTNRPIG